MSKVLGSANSRRAADQEGRGLLCANKGLDLGLFSRRGVADPPTVYWGVSFVVYRVVAQGCFAEGLRT
jgi:hypothetical protein